MENTRTLALVGAGPRGGYALERIIIELSKANQLTKIHFLLFEQSGNFGNGQIYNTSQNKSNWINISDRILLLESRHHIKSKHIEIPSFPSYHEWADLNFKDIPKSKPDVYPPRADIGLYLKSRFDSLIKPLLAIGIVSLHEEQVLNIILEEENNLTLTTDKTIYKHINEILLTIGHQLTTPSSQIIEWDKFAKDKPNTTLFKTPYPVETILNSNAMSPNSSIGIRGFGLAMIDVVRAIAERFGSFVTNDNNNKSCYYKVNSGINYSLIPFSLDGMPPAPKPLNAEIDDWFRPSKKQISLFEEKIANIDTQRTALSPHFLINAFAPIASEIYMALPQAISHGKINSTDLEIIIENWLQNNNYKNPLLLSLNMSGQKMMKKFVEMATGENPISLDYCIGQVWRYCQPSIYKKLSFNECSQQVFADIIALDESMKRYAYGPPVESIQQLLALIDADIMKLDMVKNPNFVLKSEGWCLKSMGNNRTVTLMINSVLDAPIIENVKSPIVRNMLANDLIMPIHDELGMITDENGYVISDRVDDSIHIAILGRLAKGTIIGVDALLECFGERPIKWASKAANKHISYLSRLKA